MNIIERIKTLPKDRPLAFEHLPVPGDYRGPRTDDLIALAERHERLLEAAEHMMGLLILLAKGVENFSSERTRSAREELADAIEGCNTL